MSAHIENLGRAARMLKRMEDIGGPSELEGVPLREIIRDVLEAQNRAFMEEVARRLAEPLPANVYPLVTHAGDDWSRKVIS